MVLMTMYGISIYELERRKTAFLDLLLSIYLGLITTSIFVSTSFISGNFPYIIFFSFVYFLMCLSLSSLMDRFFLSYSKSKIVLTNHYLERQTINSSEKVYFSDVKEIKVLRTTRRTIRNLNITSVAGQTISIDGIEDFDGLLMKLEKATEVSAVESFEPLDFDHQMFYPLLGLFLGTITVFFFGFIISMTQAQLKMTNCVIAGYLFLIGIYFIISQPLSKRYGYKHLKSDYAYAIVFALAGLLLLYLL